MYNYYTESSLENGFAISQEERDRMSKALESFKQKAEEDGQNSVVQNYINSVTDSTGKPND